MISVMDKAKCTGCSACYCVCPKECISMDEDKEGFLYPRVNTDECINCGKCENVCPVLNHIEIKKNENQLAALVQHKNKDILSQSTAGGAFTAIAEYVIDQDGIVFGVEMNEHFFVQHTSVEKKEELVKYRNSKYVQSFLGECYKQVKKELVKDRMVCFSGTPCQIEGLRHFLQKDYENLILIDVVCRAVPSPGVWKRYVNMEKNRVGEISLVRFRDKSLGYQYSTMELINKNGKIFRGGIESQKWLRMFFSGMIIRPSCTECVFRSNYRNSDFTIWDCFNVHSIDKSYNENLGTTRVLIHTDKAKSIIDSIQDKIKLQYIPVDIAIKGVKEMEVSPIFNKKRRFFFEDYEKLDMEVLISKYFKDTVTIKIKKYARKILNAVGIDKHIKHFLKKG